MKQKTIPVERIIAEWRKDPAYLDAYDALEDEFALVEALIDARAQAKEQAIEGRFSERHSGGKK